MAVNLKLPPQESLLPIQGIRCASTYAGIRKSEKADLALFLLDEGAVSAGVFTQNVCCAAPVQLARKHLQQKSPAALLVNAGCANAATGDGGLLDAQQSCETVAELLKRSTDAVLPFSTGVIMERLPMEKMRSGIHAAVEKANALPDYQNEADKAVFVQHQKAWWEAAHAIMTTDTVAKMASCADKGLRVTGVAKGSGMIHPNMATMLCFLACEVRVTPEILQSLTSEVADLSFNAITVDGDTSTNDSFMVVATGKVGDLIDSVAHPEYPTLYKNILQVATQLAQMIVRDGEGATKFVRIQVKEAMTPKEAMQVADKIALSPLVKTAFFASDPNLGRILSAVGNSQIGGAAGFDFSRVSLRIGEVLVAENGGRAASYNQAEEEKVLSMMRKEEFSLTVFLGRGDASATKYTNDLSYEYIKINAEYRS